MTTVSRAWSRLTLPGKIVFTVLPLLAVLTIGLILAIIVFGPFVVQLINDNLPFIRFLVAATAVLLAAIPIAFLNIFMEMKVIAFMNLRIGPDRVGPWGTLLSVVHGLKVLAKEDFTPTGADRIVFTLAPVVVFLGTVMSFLVIPFAPGLFGQDFN